MAQAGGQRCTLCSHPRLAQLEVDILAGRSLHVIAAEYGLSRQSIRRHRDGGHMRDQDADWQPIRLDDDDQDLVGQAPSHPLFPPAGRPTQAQDPTSVVSSIPPNRDTRPAKPADPKTAFLTSYVAEGDIRQALKDAQISRADLRRWQEHDEEFVLRFHQAQAEAIEHLEAEARQRAVAGSKLVRRVYRQGLLYEEIHEWRPSDTVLVKLLQANLPEKYGDKLAITNTTVLKAVDAEAWSAV